MSYYGGYSQQPQQQAYYPQQQQQGYYQQAPQYAYAPQYAAAPAPAAPAAASTFGAGFGGRGGRFGGSSGMGGMGGLGVGSGVGSNSLFGGPQGQYLTMLMLQQSGKGDVRVQRYFDAEKHAISLEFHANQQLIEIEKQAAIDQMHAQQTFDPVKGMQAQMDAQMKAFQAELDAAKMRGAAKDEVQAAQWALMGIDLGVDMARMQRGMAGDWTAFM